MSETAFSPSQLIRPNVVSLKPYTPIVPFDILSQELNRAPEDIIKLDANENPYGPSPRVAEVLAEAQYMHIYPDPESRNLRAALAEYTNLGAEYLLVGSGADELIDLIMRLFIDPGDKIVNCPPTFGMYAFDGDISAAEVIAIRRRPDFSIDVDAIETLFAESQSEPHPKLIFVTSPNNPDGSILSDSDLQRLLALPTVVVLDEAYVEFSSGSRIQWVEQHPNLIVLRTFSKWAGLAGLRVGYGAFPLDLIEQLWKIKQPYNVNLAGQLAAEVSLTDCHYLLDNVARLIEQREQFYPVLNAIEWLEPYPSQTNFILCQVKGRNASDVKQQLAEQGILVRYYNSPGLTDHIRISIGTPAQMARLAKVLQHL
ncbi:MAG: histidinol-phosphate transaminase [Anaerolineales bacterium]|nr:histidinol-phosphate transaminase [Anaerolineales bacterium]